MQPASLPGMHAGLAGGLVGSATEGRICSALEAMCNSPEWPGSWAYFLPCHGSHLPMRTLPSHASRWPGFSKWWTAGMRAS